MDKFEDQCTNGDAGEEGKSNPESSEGPIGSSGAVDQDVVNVAEWKYTETGKLQHTMCDVLRKTLEVAQLELEATKKRLNKLRYGG
jgi:hypothetical protein